jgi:hypothetical protein
VITPKDFVERWAQSSLREQQGAQSHFNELCQLVGHKTPAQLDPTGEFFTFEEQVEKATGGRGRADVWYRGHFAWEYKGRHKDLDAAYAQLLAYRGGLDNPPLLVVCDFLEYRIYPQWPNMSGQPFVFRNDDLLSRDAQNYIRWLLESPERFQELRLADLRAREQLTRQLAEKFAHLADLMREVQGEDGQPLWDSMRIARFLTRLVFSLFAEDVDLLPSYNGVGLYRAVLEGAEFLEDLPEVFRQLFEAMDGQRRSFYARAVPYFNGGLFVDSSPGAGDGTEVLDLSRVPGGLDILLEASDADWRKVDPTIFGTLFEGALDKSKRAQLGAHFTSEEDIRLIVEPVLMEPLNRAWDETRAEAEPLMQAFLKAETPRIQQTARERLITLHDAMMRRLESTRVLDPACGSGNFLYVSLRAMKDLEARVRRFFDPLGLPFRDVVTPRQLYGIEKDPFAARLAHVVAWIGYLQWRYEDEGLLHPVLPHKIPHPRALPHPIIQDKNRPDEPDRVICDDSIMRYDASGQPYEPDWPEVDVIVSNPPFLGGKRMRSEMGDAYVNALFALYDGRVPAEADLVCYWYEKARAHIAQGKAKRAGMLATNSIRGGPNQQVLRRIKETGNIFLAWSDRPWVLEGAAVRISLVAFDDGSQKTYLLDGAPVNQINADLQNTIDATQARSLPENLNITYMGVTPGGPFDISDEEARQMLNAPLNPNGRPNSDVVRPYYNAKDLVQYSRASWTINFTGMREEEAAQYELPFAYVRDHVRLARLESRQPEREKAQWWIYTRSRPELRAAIEPLTRYIATPMVSKHRVFVWLSKEIVPANLINVIARDDDYFFGVLHSKLHERWSLRLGTFLGKGNDPRYTPTTTFETFPFPWPPGKEDTKSPAYKAIAAAAQQLHAERDAWLNPSSDMLEGPARDAMLRQLTLTNLYNALVEYREHGGPRNGKALTPAQVFVPRLHELHTALNRAVCDAYGWPYDVLDDEEEMLRRLLALNLERAGDT